MAATRKKAAPKGSGGRKQPDRMTREQYARETLREVHEDLNDARKNGPKSNVPLLLREARAAREELDIVLREEATASGGDPFEEMDDEELHNESVSALREFPDHLLEPLAEEMVNLLGRQWFEHYLQTTALRVVPAER